MNGESVKQALGFLIKKWRYYLVAASGLIAYLYFPFSIDRRFASLLSSLELAIFSIVFFYPVFVVFYSILTRRNSESSVQSADEESSFEQQRNVSNAAAPIKGSSSWKKKLLHVILFSAALAGVVYVQSRRFYTLSYSPQGADTPNYLYVVNLIAHGQVLFLLGDQRVLTYALSYVVLGILGIFRISEIYGMMILPFVLLAIFSLSLYYFVYSTSKSAGLAALSVLISGVTLFVSRMLIDLFSNILSLSFCFFGLAEYYLWATGRRSYRFGLVSTASFFVLSLLANQFFWLFLVVILIVIQIVGWFNNFRHIRLTILSILPSVAVLVFQSVANLFFANTAPPQFYERFASGTSGLISPLALSAAYPFSLPTTWNWIAAYESPYIILVAAFSVLLLWRDLTKQNLLLLAWCAVCPILLITTGYIDTERLIVIFPEGIVAAYGIWLLLAARRGSDPEAGGGGTSSRRGRIIPWKWIKVLIGIFLLLLIVGTSFSYTIFPNYVFFPGNQAVNELQYIRNTYGFANPAVTILINPGTVDTLNSFNYARAITGNYVYLGGLFDFLEGNPFIVNGATVHPKVGLTNDIVLIPTSLYTVGKIETNLGTQVYPGVIAINIPDRYSMLSYIENNFLKMSSVSITNFTQGWSFSGPSLSYTATTDSSGTLLLSENDTNGPYGTATYQYIFGTQFSSGEAAFDLKCNLQSLYLRISVIYADSTHTSITFYNTVIQNNYEIYSMPLNASATISAVNFVFFNYTNVRQLQAPEWIQFNWIAFS